MLNSRKNDRLADLAVAFDEFLREYPRLDIGSRVHIFDGFALWRTLFRRNPDPETELPFLLNFSGTYRQLLTQLADSAEFASGTPVLPRGYRWMAEIDGFRFWFETGDREMGVRMAMGLYEPAVRDLMKKTITNGMRCIDAGANTGYYSCFMGGLVGAEGKVYAFEPMPESYRMLEKNVAENNLRAVVETHPLACSSRRTVIEATVLSNMFVAGASEEGVKAAMAAVPVDEVVFE